MIREALAELLPERSPLARFAREAVFQAPDYIAPSAWIEHVPFAFWMIDALKPASFVELGTHHGTSYFAFCQEIRRQGLPTRAWAVDTWKGDEHAGFYGEEVWEAVDRHNRMTYPGFSTLLREEFAAAVLRSQDRSVDLLHIDGLHSFEAVSADFETWLPKLSRRAVVLLHDTQVRDRGFGVFRLVEHLRTRYPIFEFSHGHGLAVVGVGPKQPQPLRALFAAEADAGRKGVVEQLFARLGRTCLIEMERSPAPATRAPSRTPAPPAPPKGTAYSRITGVFGDYVLAGKSGLEIGALSRPFLKGIEGVTVFNLDHLPTEKLKEKYFGNRRIRQEDIVPVDFVLDGERPIHEIVAAKAPFDFAVGIHVGEHVPDLLGWLDDIATALSSSGVIALALPDKRRCFDVARPLSTVGEVVGAQIEGRKRPPPAVVFEAYSNLYVHRGHPVWVPVLKLAALQKSGSLTLGYDQARLAREQYVDAHCWVFTARSFVRVMQALHELALLKHRIRHFEVPPAEYAEFHVLFEKCEDAAAIADSLRTAWAIADRDPIPG